VVLGVNVDVRVNAVFGFNVVWRSIGKCSVMYNFLDAHRNRYIVVPYFCSDFCSEVERCIYIRFPHNINTRRNRIFNQSKFLLSFQVRNNNIKARKRKRHNETIILPV
jgi:hypothetical protein